MKFRINLETLKNDILRARKTRHEKYKIAHYFGYEDVFFIEYSEDDYVKLYDEDWALLQSVQVTDDNFEKLLSDIAEIFAVCIDIWLITKHDKKSDNKPADYEQKYWDCQRQIDQYERERKELQERIDILNHNWGQEYQSVEKFKTECSKLEDDKKKAEERIKELKCKVTKLEVENKQLDERNTYITHHFGDLRKEYRSLNIKLECALDHVNSALDITKRYDPSWTLVEDRLKIIQRILSQDTPKEEESCEGCKYEDWQLTHIKCMICKTQKTQYEAKHEPKSCEKCRYAGFIPPCDTCYGHSKFESKD